MDCHKAQAMLSACHDGELSEDDRAQVESHLRACPDCAAILESLARIDAAAEVPDPGPEYWESFNRRVQERVGREEARPKATVVPHPERGWMRRQIRYLVPAVAAAAMVVMAVRHIGLDPGSPVPPAPKAVATLERGERTSAEKAIPRRPAPAPAPSPHLASVPASPAPPAEAGRVPPYPSISPPAVAGERHAAVSREARERAADRASETAHDRPVRTAPAEGGIDRVAAGKNIPDVADRHPAVSGASVSSGASRETAAPEPPVATASGRETAPSAAEEQAAGAAASTMRGGARSESAVKSKEVSSRRPSASPCEEARSLAARGRFKEAESAQRACLAGDPSPPSQESGLVFLAELLDRQNRFAEADSVIEEAQTRFPRSRPLELYREQRPQVQGGRLPFPSNR